MSTASTSIEFGLVNALRTGNVVVDTLACMFIPLLVQRVHRAMRGRDSIDYAWSLLYCVWNYFERAYVLRTVESVQYVNRFRVVRDENQKNQLLQKAIMIYLGDVLDLDNNNATYQLLEKPKTYRPLQRTKCLDEIAFDETDSCTTASSTASERSYDSHCDDAWINQKEGQTSEVDRLNWGALPPLCKWVTVEPGLEFMHEVIKNRKGAVQAALSQSRVLYHFRSREADASTRIDAFIDRAFESYRALERKKMASDRRRYMHVAEPPSSTVTILSNEADKRAAKAAAKGKPVREYNRYALSEEKTLDSIFFAAKRDIKQLLDHFQARTGKFAIKGFPNKLGLLLHGPPGAGKTSLIKAIAQYTKRHVVMVSLAQIKTNQELMDIMCSRKLHVSDLDLPVPVKFKDLIFVLEDIDCASSIVKKRSDKSEPVAERGGLSSLSKLSLDDCTSSTKYTIPDELNLAGLLNVLDGVVDSPGRMVIMTSNHPEHLDPALIRPGRVNKKLFLGHMQASEICEMLEYYFACSLSATDMSQVEAMTVRGSCCVTPAQVEEYCAECDTISDVLKALMALA